MTDCAQLQAARGGHDGVHLVDAHGEGGGGAGVRAEAPLVHQRVPVRVNGRGAPESANKRLYI